MSLDGSTTEFESRPSREPIHTKPDLCKFLLTTVISHVGLKIAESLDIVPGGSGLFVTEPIAAGCDVYNSEPLVSCADGEARRTFCHYCLRDSYDTVEEVNVPDTPGPVSFTKACMGCKVARFCSKVCQRKGWSKFHKDECKVLRDTPKLPARHLVLYRLLFWQERKMIPKIVGRALDHLETHFVDYFEESDRATNMMRTVMAIREETKSKLDLAVVWRMLPAMMTNCIRLRPAAERDRIGAALDLVTSTINHSCDPNAFVFFEGTQLRVRTLKDIKADEEITICYVDSTMDAGIRRGILKTEHFFVCICNRCQREIGECERLLGRDAGKMRGLRQAQLDMLELTRNAMNAAKYPGVHKAFEDLATVERQLHAIVRRPFPDGVDWPSHLEPLPSTRLALARLQRRGGLWVPAVANAIRGLLLGGRRGGPEWINDMKDVVDVLIAVGELPSDGTLFLAGTFPDLFEMRDIAMGYLYVMHKEVERVYGKVGSMFSATMRNMFEIMVEKVGDPRPGTEEFAKDFTAAQRKLLSRMEIDESYDIRLPKA